MTALCFGLNPVTLKLAFARHGRADVAVVVGLAVAIPIYVLLLPFWGGLMVAFAARNGAIYFTNWYPQYLRAKYGAPPTGALSRSQ